MNAVCANFSGDEMLKHFRIEPAGDGTTVDVRVTVNGVEVEVDVVTELNRAIVAIDASFNQAVEDAARALVSRNSTLQGLANAIADAEWAINERLRTLLASPGETT